MSWAMGVAGPGRESQDPFRGTSRALVTEVPSFGRRPVAVRPALLRPVPTPGRTARPAGRWRRSGGRPPAPQAPVGEARSPERAPPTGTTRLSWMYRLSK
ncbi:hypothetical protein GCM10022197_07320 [Microlunatus spumicola]|uniref:Uncharacterized protein n=1 Tax=Microlunatus spumicola TaxID=81499 RepID=A0ABP6WQW8_9ACTN